MSRILIIEDDKDIQKLLTLCLRPLPVQLHTVSHGIEGLTLFRNLQPDLIILDLKLPDIDGLAVCAKIRKEIQLKQPIILMLTSRHTNKDHVIGYQMGADHYFTKPFDIVALRTQIKESLKTYALSKKHQGTTKPHTITYNTLHLSTSNLTITSGNSSTTLTFAEARILETLMRNPGLAFSRRQLLDSIWDTSHPSSERTIDVHVSSLRKKIADIAPTCKSYIRSISRVGYTLAQ